MGTIPLVDPATAPPAAKQLLDAVQAKLGIVPNLFKVMAHAPGVLGAVLGTVDALGKGKLDGKLRERIALAVAESNRCGYCVSAHTAIGKMNGLSEGEINDARDYKASDARTQTALRFVERVVTRHGAVEPSDVESLRKAGFDNGEIIEIIANIVNNILTNYVNLVASTEIDFPKVALHAQVA